MAVRVSLSKSSAAQAPARKRAGFAPGAKSVVDGAEREQMIREAAYFHAQRRAFAPGGELEDWLMAEREIDGGLAQSAAFVEPVRRRFIRQ